MNNQFKIYQGAFICVIFCIIILIINIFKLAALPNIKEYSDDGIEKFYPVNYYIREGGQDISEKSTKYFVSYQTVDKLHSFTQGVESADEAKALIEQNNFIEMKILLSNETTNNNKIIDSTLTLEKYYSELKSPYIRWIIAAILGIIVIVLIISRYMQQITDDKLPLHDE
ncbi:MAG: hypothetical protein ATN35_12950 [Epulopiscium sp. Nele67-Bin004]|nr:MAG: hypothetical protein ATN35_12950 [Epulopiscium sp. Nele67-Bin004]